MNIKIGDVITVIGNTKNDKSWLGCPFEVLAIDGSFLYCRTPQFQYTIVILNIDETLFRYTALDIILLFKMPTANYYSRLRDSLLKFVKTDEKSWAKNLNDDRFYRKEDCYNYYDYYKKTRHKEDCYNYYDYYKKTQKNKNSEFIYQKYS